MKKPVQVLVSGVILSSFHSTKSHLCAFELQENNGEDVRAER